MSSFGCDEKDGSRPSADICRQNKTSVDVERSFRMSKNTNKTQVRSYINNTQPQTYLRKHINHHPCIYLPTTMHKQTYHHPCTNISTITHERTYLPTPMRQPNYHNNVRLPASHTCAASVVANDGAQLTVGADSTLSCTYSSDEFVAPTDATMPMPCGSSSSSSSTSSSDAS